MPLNNRLASADPDNSGTEALWANYLSRWTLWNHVRTTASLAAAGLFAMAFCGGKCASEQRIPTMEVTEEVVERAELLIRKPAAQVFQAFVDPDVTTKFWFVKRKNATQMPVYRRAGAGPDRISHLPSASRSRKNCTTFCTFTGPSSALMASRISRMERVPSAKFRASSL